MRIKEVIIVEGKDDRAAVLAALKCEIITTSGFGLNDKIIKNIKSAHEKMGIIIFTDPDFAGEKIRERLNKLFPGSKNAFLPRAEGEKDGDIGIENASPESIIRALEKVRTLVEDSKTFKKMDLILNDLEGSPTASQRRDALGAYLGIGYGNGKQFLKRLNHYGITREEFEEGLKNIS